MTFHEGEPTDGGFERDQPELNDVDPIDSDYSVDGVTADDGEESDIDDNGGDDPIFTDGKKPNFDPANPGDEVMIEIDWTGIGPLPEIEVPEFRLSDDSSLADALAAAREALASGDWLPPVGSEFGARPALSDELQGSIDQWAGEDAESNPDDPTSGFMDFRQPFDGMQPELPLSEQKAAGALLGSYLNERVPEGQVAGFHENYTTDEGVLNVGMDNGSLNRLIGDQHPETDEPRVEGTLSVAKWMGRGQDPGEGSVYQLGTDGVVRRYDRAEPTLESEMAKAASIQEIRGPEDREGWTEEDKARHLDKVMDVVDNDDANDRMTEALGLNRQPVGPREVARAIRYAEQVMRNPRYFEGLDDDLLEDEAVPPYDDILDDLPNDDDF